MKDQTISNRRPDTDKDMIHPLHHPSTHHAILPLVRAQALDTKANRECFAPYHLFHGERVNVQPQGGLKCPPQGGLKCPLLGERNSDVPNLLECASHSTDHLPPQLRLRDFDLISQHYTYSTRCIPSNCIQSRCIPNHDLYSSNLPP